MTLFGYQLNATSFRPSRATASGNTALNEPCSLAAAPRGRQMRVISFDGSVPATRQAQLQSYGLAPGYEVRVVQHNPVTIVQIEHLELALETELARQIQVILAD